MKPDQKLKCDTEATRQADDPKDEEIADLKRQIEALNEELDSFRRGSVQIPGRL